MAEYEINLVRRNMPPSAVEDGTEYLYHVQNYHDNMLFRYATYGLDGIIKGYGNEMTPLSQGNNFIIQRGAAVVQGNTIEVPSSGISINLGTSPTTMYWSVYAEINRSQSSNEMAKIIVDSQTGSYPAMPTYPPSEDLTANPQGIARLELFLFTSANGIVNYIEHRAQVIEYATELIRNEVSKIKQKKWVEIYSTTVTSSMTGSQTNLPNTTLAERIVLSKDCDLIKIIVNQAGSADMTREIFVKSFNDIENNRLCGFVSASENLGTGATGSGVDLFNFSLNPTGGTVRLIAASRSIGGTITPSSRQLIIKIYGFKEQ